MKKITLIFIFLSGFTYSQIYNIGFTGDILTGNKNLNYLVGPALIAEYLFKDLPLSVRVNARFYLGELTSDGFSADYTYTDFSIGPSIGFYPIEWSIEPYIGAGVYYNSNNFTKNGNQSLLHDGTLGLLGNVENNISFEISAGVKFSARSPLNFIVEVTQTFNQPADYIIMDGYSDKILSKKKLDFDSLILKLGLLFRI
jgi:hypothetical protein